MAFDSRSAAFLAAASISLMVAEEVLMSPENFCSVMLTFFPRQEMVSLVKEAPAFVFTVSLEESIGAPYLLVKRSASFEKLSLLVVR